MKYVSICLYGKVANWKHSASDHTSTPSKSLIKFSAFMFHENVYNPNLKNIDGVYIHTWNPNEAEYINSLYNPTRSLHQKVVYSNKVKSQHLSIEKCLNLIDNRNAPMVFVCRIDTVFFKNFIFPTFSNNIWLSHLCMQSLSMKKNIYKKVNEICGKNKGRILETYHLKRDLGFKAFNNMTDYEYSSFVADEWFISNLSIAYDFSIVKQYKTVKKLRQWSHYYWAENVKQYTAKNVKVKFMHLKGISSNLARFSKFGVDCVIPQDSVMTRRNFKNTKHWAFEMCPSDIANGKSVMCDWDSPKCPTNHTLEIKYYLDILNKIKY